MTFFFTDSKGNWRWNARSGAWVGPFTSFDALLIAWHRRRKR